MAFGFRILLNLAIVFGAAKMDSSGYGVFFTLVALARYELGPMLASKDDE